MPWLKERCPRCNGSLYVEQDLKVKYKKCIMCGRRWKLWEELALLRLLEKI